MLFAVATALMALWAPVAASAATGSISGKVTVEGSGDPVQSAQVCGERVQEDFVYPICATTGADGSFEITGLQPGAYPVRFEPPSSSPNLIGEYYDGASGWEDATRVNVSSGPVTGIDAALAQGGAVTGRVIAASTGAPIFNASVCSWREDGAGYERCTQTRFDGSYELTSLPPGLHEIEFWAFELGFESETLRGIPVSAGTTTPNADAALVRAGRITGHVYAAANHQPLGGVSVCAIWAESGEIGGCAHTSSSGGYEFFPAEAGAWKIVFSPQPADVESFDGVDADLWTTQFWNLKPTLAEADPIGVVPAQDVTGIDGLLDGGQPQLPVGGSSTNPGATPIAVKPKPKRLHCGKGKVKKRVKGKQRCVKRHKHHKPGHHKKRHHRN